MKLIMAIVNGNDSKSVIKELMHSGFQITKLASSGGFLRAKSVTILCGVTNERVDACLEIIARMCSAKNHSLKSMTPESTSLMKVGELKLPENSLSSGEIVYGGATVFVMNIEKTMKF